MDRVIRKHYDKQPLKLKLRTINPSISPNISGRYSSGSNRSYRSSRSREEYYNESRSGRKSRSGSRKRDSEMSFEEKFKQHMEKRLGMKAKRQKQKRKTSKSSRAGKKSKSRKHSSQRTNCAKKTLNPIPAPNVSKNKVKELDYINLKNHMKNLKSSAFNKMDNISKGLSALRNMGSKKNSRKGSRSPNYGSRSRKSRHAERKCQTQKYAINNYLKTVVSEKPHRKRSKRSNRAKKSSQNSRNQSNEISARYIQSSRYIPMNRRGSTSPRVQHNKRRSSRTVNKKIDSRIQTIADGRLRDESKNSRRKSYSPTGKSSLNQSQKEIQMSRISKKMIETFKLYQIGKNEAQTSSEQHLNLEQFEKELYDIINLTNKKKSLEQLAVQFHEEHSTNGKLGSQNTEGRLSSRQLSNMETKRRLKEVVKGKKLSFEPNKSGRLSLRERQSLMSHRSTSRTSRQSYLNNSKQMFSMTLNNENMKPQRSVSQKMKDLVDKTFRQPYGNQGCKKEIISKQYKECLVSTNYNQNQFQTKQHSSKNSIRQNSSQRLVQKEYFDSCEHSSSKKELVWDAYTNKHIDKLEKSGSKLQDKPPSKHVKSNYSDLHDIQTNDYNQYLVKLQQNSKHLTSGNFQNLFNPQPDLKNLNLNLNLHVNVNSNSQNQNESNQEEGFQVRDSNKSESNNSKKSSKHSQTQTEQAELELENPMDLQQQDSDYRYVLNVNRSKDTDYELLKESIKQVSIQNPLQTEEIMEQIANKMLETPHIQSSITPVKQQKVVTPIPEVVTSCEAQYAPKVTPVSNPPAGEEQNIDFQPGDDIFKQLAFSKALEKQSKEESDLKQDPDTVLQEYDPNSIPSTQKKSHNLSLGVPKDMKLQQLVHDAMNKTGTDKENISLSTPKVMNQNIFQPRNKLRNSNNSISNSSDQASQVSKSSSIVKKVQKQVNPLQQPQILSPHSHREPFTEYFALKYGVGLDEYSNLDFIKNCGDQIYKIVQYLKQGKNPYNNIRLYTDHAQEEIFDKMEHIFECKEAGNLFSKILKLERWSIILLFYFNLIKKDASNGKRMLGEFNFSRVKPKGKAITKEEIAAINAKLLKDLEVKLYELMKDVWRNHNNLVNWIKQINRIYNLNWVLNDANRIYFDVKLDKIRLILEIKSCSMVVTGLINQM